MSGPEPKPGILTIPHYVPGKAKAAGFDSPIKLSANENALGSSEAARRAYADALRELNKYPDANSSDLRAALAAKHGLEPSRLVFGTGSDELFSIACQIYLQPGDNIVQPEFGFAAWAIAARAAGGEVKNAPEKHYTADIDAMLEAVDARTRIVFIANPANPTGTCVPFSEMERLHAGLPPHVLLLLDGAYVDYARMMIARDADLNFARGLGNVLVTRTFSKLHGLAALRVGWGYAAQPIVDAMERVRLPFNVSRPGQAAAVAGLADDDFVERSIAHAEVGRMKLEQELGGYGLEPVRSMSNFVTAHVPAARGLSAAALEAQLAERGILIRHLANYGMPDCVRITIGTDAQMAVLSDVLKEILG